METLHNSQYYTADLHPIAGLIIQSKRKAGGVRLTSDHPKYAEWVAPTLSDALWFFGCDPIFLA